MHFDNLLFILLGLAFVVLRWLAQRAVDSKKQPPPEQPERPTRASAESDEERVRRLMEALGNPVGSKPPPKVRTRPVQQPGSGSVDATRGELEGPRQRPKKSIWTAPLPPLTTTPPPVPSPKRVTSPQSIKTAPVAVRTSAPATPAPFAVVQQMAAQAPAATAPVTAYGAASQRQPRLTGIPTDVQTLLSSPDGLRNAIILRELLGTPRAFQPLEHL